MLAIAVLVVGAALFFYPLVSNTLASMSQTRAIASYDESIVAMAEEQRAEEWQRAVRYNESLAGDPVRDPFLEGSGRALPQEYTEVLNVDGTMGYLDIVKIGVHLPIYHGTDDEVLAKGVGHIRQTALPVGGAGTHSVLTGHTGLPSAQLFTDLDQLEVGDEFVLSVLGRKLAYKVDAINVVLPEQTELLDPTPGEDHVTLITCTPYGVNSHRLLVRGERVDYVEPAVPTPVAVGPVVGTSTKILTAMGLSALAAAVVLGAAGLVRRRRQKRAGTGEVVPTSLHAGDIRAARRTERALRRAKGAARSTTDGWGTP